MCSIGVDVTGGGRDPLVLVPRYDGWIGRAKVIPGERFIMEEMGSQIAGEIIGMRRDKALIIIDLGGGYGSSAYEQLNTNDIEVFGYKGSMATNDRSKVTKMGYRNVRSAAIWKFREALDPSQPGGSPISLPPDDPELVADLTAPTYKIVNNIIHIESKEDVVERLGRSTDRGDAAVMAWYRGMKDETHALDLIDMKQRHAKRGQRPRVIMSRQPRTGRRQ
jgi:hypothetical protein